MLLLGFGSEPVLVTISPTTTHVFVDALKVANFLTLANAIACPLLITPGLCDFPDTLVDSSVLSVTLAESRRERVCVLFFRSFRHLTHPL
jgi:hypothetical protein